MAAAVLAACLALSPGTDGASDSVPEVYYCYGNYVEGSFGNPDPSITVSWEVSDENGAPVDPGLIRYENGGRTVIVDAHAMDRVVLKQTVSRGSETDTKTAVMIPLHMETTEVRKVTFIDRGEVVKEQTITSTGVVREGDQHVYPPSVKREGYTFKGWFTEQALVNLFDPSKPVERSLTVFAGWEYDSGSTQVILDTCVVTFRPAEGLSLGILDKGSDWVSFDVSVKEGYAFEEGSMTVLADGKPLAPSGGKYLLRCTSDTDVTIDGKRLYTVAYDLTGAVIAVDGFQDPPRVFPEGGFKATVKASGGQDLSIRVYSDGRDITSQCVNGDRILIDSATGNILIVASSSGAAAGFPWIYVVFAIALFAVLAAVILRSHPNGRH